MTTRYEAWPHVATRQGSSVVTWAVLWLSGPLVVLLALAWGWLTYFDGRFFPGVVVGDVSLAGETWTDAQTLLERSYPQPALPPLEITWRDRVWFLYPEDVDFRYQMDEALAAAYTLGRDTQQGPLWLTYLRLWREGERIPIPVTVSEGAARQWLNRVAASLYAPLQEPTVALQGQEVVYNPGRPGREVDVDRSWQALEAALTAAQAGTWPSPPVSLTVRETGVPPLDVQDLTRMARRIATRPLILRVGDQQLALDAAQLGQAITLIPERQPDGRVVPRVEVNRERLRAILAGIAAHFDRPPVDARLDYDPAADRFIVVRPSQDGWRLDVDGAVEAVVAALAEGRWDVEVPVEVVKPRVPMDATPAALGIREVIGEGTTVFRGSSAARVANIVRAAEAVRGVVIPPGEVFSFNEAAGAITAANGYEDSLIIWGDRTAVGIGGGVCQVSTTLFRAAFFAGLPIVERWNHGYIVSWYGEPGLDATVYSPYVDFKFKNTTDAYVLVQPVVDLERGVLTFRLWGTDPGWEVEVSPPVRENVQEPPPPVYQEDPSLPTGVIRQVEWAKPGMTVRITRTVRRGTTVLEQREFVSTYQPWRAVYLYGPGTEVPAQGTASP